MEFYQVKILDIIEEFDDVKSFVLEKPENLSWNEGASIHLGLEGFRPKFEGDKPNKELVRHFSISTLTEDDKIILATRIPDENRSIFKENFDKLKIGDSVTLFKIHSHMKLRRENKPITLISMGIGIVTYKNLISTYKKDKTRIPAITNLNVSKNGNFLFKESFDQMESENFRNIWTNNKEEFYKTLEDLLSIDKDSLYYIVGSDKFIKDVLEAIKKYHIELDRILIDKRDEKKIEFFEKPQS